MESSSIEGSSGESNQGTMKKQAAHIVSQIERNSTLMENDPLAEHLRTLVAYINIVCFCI